MERAPELVLGKRLIDFWNEDLEVKLTRLKGSRQSTMVVTLKNFGCLGLFTRNCDLVGLGRNMSTPPCLFPFSATVWV